MNQNEWLSQKTVEASDFKRVLGFDFEEENVTSNICSLVMSAIL